MRKSIKKSLLLVMSLVFVFTFTIPVYAADTTSGSYLLDDKAGLLLYDDEAYEVLEALETATYDSQCNIVVLTSIEGLAEGTIEEYARNYYKTAIENQQDFNHTIICTVDMTSRKVNIHGFNVDGSMQTINDNEATEIREYITDDLTNGDYDDAFERFAKKAGKIAKSINPDGTLNKSAFPWGTRLLISLAIGFVIALIISLALKKQLKSVEMKANASDYIRPNSMNITGSRDQFLYSNVTKTAKPKDNDSGGGSSRGGGGGSSTGSF